MSPVRPGLWACTAAVVTGFALVATAVTVTATSERPGPEFGAVAPPPGMTSDISPESPSPTTAVSSTASPSPADSLPLPVRRIPDQLVLPRLQVTAPVQPVVVRTDRSLVVPSDPGQVGWWAGGAVPGAVTGTIVLAGHVDDARLGPGALYHLTRLRPGDEVHLDTPAGRYSYRITARRSYSKQHLPADLFTPGGPARLILITCGGAFQPGRGYADNLVVYAETDPPRQ